MISGIKKFFKPKKHGELTSNINKKLNDLLVKNPENEIHSILNNLIDLLLKRDFDKFKDYILKIHNENKKTLKSLPLYNSTAIFSDLIVEEVFKTNDLNRLYFQYQESKEVYCIFSLLTSIESSHLMFIELLKLGYLTQVIKNGHSFMEEFVIEYRTKDDFTKILIEGISNYKKRLNYNTIAELDQHLFFNFYVGGQFITELINISSLMTFLNNEKLLFLYSLIIEYNKIETTISKRLITESLKSNLSPEGMYYFSYMVFALSPINQIKNNLRKSLKPNEWSFFLKSIILHADAQILDKLVSQELIERDKKFLQREENGGLISCTISTIAQETSDLFKSIECAYPNKKNPKILWSKENVNFEYFFNSEITDSIKQELSPIIYSHKKSAQTLYFVIKTPLDNYNNLFHRHNWLILINYRISQSREDSTFLSYGYFNNPTTFIENILIEIEHELLDARDSILPISFGLIKFEDIENPPPIENNIIQFRPKGSLPANDNSVYEDRKVA